MIIFRNSGLFSVCLLFSVVLSSHTSFVAYAAKGIEISPVLTEISIGSDWSEDDEKVIPLIFKNNSDQDSKIKLSASSFGISETVGVPLLDASYDSLNEYNFNDNISFSEKNFQLKPNDIATVEAKLNNIKKMPSGGHYGVINADIVTDVAGPVSQVAIKYSLSSLLMIRKQEGEVIDFSLETIKSSSTWWSLPKKATINFVNNGNVHIVPRGFVVIKDVFGRRISKGIINNNSIYIVPKTERELESRLDRVSSFWIPGLYIISSEYRDDGSEDKQKYTSFLMVGKGYVLLFFLTTCSISGIVIMKKKYPREYKKMILKYRKFKNS